MVFLARDKWCFCELLYESGHNDDICCLVHKLDNSMTSSKVFHEFRANSS